MKRIRCFAAVFCLLLLLAGCAGEPKVKRTIEGMKTYAEMTDGTWTCDGRSYAYRLEIRGRLHSAACDSVFVYLSNVPEISFERAAKAAGLSSNSDDYFAPEEARAGRVGLSVTTQPLCIRHAEGLRHLRRECRWTAGTGSAS